MPNSLVTFTGNGSNRTFSFAGIDDYLSTSYLKVYINNQLIDPANYTFDLTGSNENVVFTVAYGAPANGATVKIARETPNTVAGFTSNVVDFVDGSVLTAEDLDRGFKGLLHIVQEGNDTGSGAMGKTADFQKWDAGSLRITNAAQGLEMSDLVTKAQLDATSVYGGSVTVPQAWQFTGNGSTTKFSLSNPAPAATDPLMFIVDVGGIIQRPGGSPNDYTIDAEFITFTTAPGAGVGIRIRNFGVARNAIQAIPTGSITYEYLAPDSVLTANIRDGNVTSSKMALNSVPTAAIQGGAVTDTKLAANAVTTASIQNLQVTSDKLGPEAVTTAKIGSLSVTSDKIGTGAVTGEKLATNAVSFQQMNQQTSVNVFASSGADRFLKVGTTGALSLAPVTSIPANNPTSDLSFSSDNGLNGYQIKGLKNPTAVYDAANKGFVEGPRIGQTAYVAMNVGVISLNISGNSNVAFTGTTVSTLACPTGQTYSGLIYGSNGGYAKYDVLSTGSTFSNIGGSFGGNANTTTFLAVLVRTS